MVEKVLHSLASMAGVGLFQRSKTWELMSVVCRFTMHSNLWIRHGEEFLLELGMHILTSLAATEFITAASKWFSPADIHCVLFPLLRPYLKADIIDASQETLLEYLMSPVGALSIP